MSTWTLEDSNLQCGKYLFLKHQKREDQGFRLLGESYKVCTITHQGERVTQHGAGFTLTYKAKAYTSLGLARCHLAAHCSHCSRPLLTMSAPQFNEGACSLPGGRRQAQCIWRLARTS
eukprot:6199256-Pleurochrysis_carterae.AAC.1